MSQWFCSSGLGPGPSSGAMAAAQGTLLVSRQPMLAASTHTWNGLAMVAINPKKYRVMRPMMPSAPIQSGSMSLERRERR